MARKVIPPTEIQIKNAKSTEKEYKMFNGSDPIGRVWLVKLYGQIF